jgi:hypothetical protein
MYELLSIKDLSIFERHTGQRKAVLRLGHSTARLMLPFVPASPIAFMDDYGSALSIAPD